MTPSSEYEGHVREFNRMGRYGSIAPGALDELAWFIDEPRDPFNEGQPVAFGLMPDRTHNDRLAAVNVEPVRIVC